MKYIDCTFCGKDNKEYLHPEIADAGSLHGYNYVYCSACRIAYLNPLPEPSELDDYYSGFVSEDCLSAEELARFKLDSLKRRMINRMGIEKGGAVLDIGCGKGETVYCLAREGYNIAGLEPFSSRPFADEDLNRRIIRKQLAEAAFPDGNFSMVLLWSVLEHIADPLPLLKEISRITRPGGYFMLSVPNLNTVQHSLMKMFWPGFGPPAHVFVYTIKGIQKILGSMGFRLFKNFRDPIHDQWMLKQSIYLRFMDGEKFKFGIHASKEYSKAQRSLFGIYSFLVVRSEMLVGKSATANLVFRKEL